MAKSSFGERLAASSKLAALNGALRANRMMVERRGPINVTRMRKDSRRASEMLAARQRHSIRRTVNLGSINGEWFDVSGADPDTVLLYLPGGAFITDTPALHGGFVDQLAFDVGVNALMPRYRLAPEYQFPVGYNDVFEAYEWLLAQGFDGSRIIVAGDSAGGNLALGLAQRIVTHGLPAPSCVVALSPVTDATFGSDSIERNRGNDAMFSPEILQKFAMIYAPPPTDLGDPRISVINGRMEGLPPILILVGSTELLLDDSTRFAAECDSADVQVWHDMPHVFPFYEFLPQAERARIEIAAYMRLHLEPEVNLTSHHSLLG